MFQLRSPQLTLRFIGIAIVCAAPTPLVFAQESATEVATAESPYIALQKSTDKLTRQWAERYANLIKLQEWSSDKGTKIKAKYVSHDGLKSVTLAIVKGSGANRVAKEVTVPVERLSKTSQSRVKQIDTIQKKLDELGTATPTEPGLPMTDERGVQPPPRRVERVRRGATARENREAPAADTRTSSAPDDGNPDPLGFAEIPADEGAIATGTFVVTPGPPPIAPTPGAADSNDRDAVRSDGAEWRTSYEAFRNAIRVDNSRGTPTIDWGPLKELQAAVAEVEKWEVTGNVGEKEHAEIKKQFDAVGEFTWEATLAEADTPNGDWTARLNLPPLPEPLSIGFILETDREAGNWQRLKTGERVRFVGRFVDSVDGDLIAAIRFPGEQPAAGR